MHSIKVVQKKGANSAANARVSECLGNQSGSGGGFVLPVRWQLLGNPVVASEAVHAGLDENEAEFRVLFRLRKMYKRGFVFAQRIES